MVENSRNYSESAQEKRDDNFWEIIIPGFMQFNYRTYMDEEESIEVPPFPATTYPFRSVEFKFNFHCCSN